MYLLDDVLGVVIGVDELVARLHDAFHARLVGVQLGGEILVLLYLALKVGRVLQQPRETRACQQLDNKL